MKHGKKYIEAAKQVDRAVAYEPAEAVALAKKTAITLHSNFTTSPQLGT